VFNFKFYFRKADTREDLLSLEITRAKLQIDVLKQQKVNLEQEFTNLNLQQQIFIHKLSNLGFIFDVES